MHDVFDATIPKFSTERVNATTGSAPWTLLRNMRSVILKIHSMMTAFLLFKNKKAKERAKRTLSWLPNDFEYRKFMHEITSLFPLARLAVGFGRKRAALSPVTRSWRIPLNSPRDPKKKSNTASQSIRCFWVSEWRVSGNLTDVQALLVPPLSVFGDSARLVHESKRCAQGRVPIAIPRTSVLFPRNNSLKRWYPVSMHVVKQHSTTFF